jgi:hypothetical protein
MNQKQSHSSGLPRTRIRGFKLRRAPMSPHTQTNSSNSGARTTRLTHTTPQRQRFKLRCSHQPTHTHNPKTTVELLMFAPLILVHVRRTRHSTYPIRSKTPQERDSEEPDLGTENNPPRPQLNTGDCRLSPGQGPSTFPAAFFGVRNTPKAYTLNENSVYD